MGDIVEDRGLVHSALGHQEIDVGMKIYPSPECFNGVDNPGPELAPADHLKIARQAVV